MNKKLFLALVVIITFQLPLASKETASAASWYELVCETGDYIPIDIRGIWGSSSTEVFFVGDAGYIFYYDGQSCYPMLDNHFSNIEMLYGIWGSSGRDVFAVGGNYGQILHFNGYDWSIIRTTKEPQNLYGVWGYAPDDVFAVGEDGIILRYDGETWSEMESGTPWDLHAIWGTTPDNIYAAGYAGTLLHYDGMTWSSVYLGGVYNNVLYDIWGSSSNDIYIVGDSGRYVNNITGIVYHFNGSNWAPQFLDFSFRGLYEDGALHGVWGSAPDNVYAVGGDYWGGGIIHYDGEHWTVVDSGIQSNLFDIWGTSGKDIYTVGFGYRIFRFGVPSLITTSSSSTTTGLSSTTSTIIDDCPLDIIYGAHNEKTQFLRQFRDEVLNKTPEGRELIKLYYQWSPAIVKGMEEDEDFKNLLHENIEAILPMLRSIED